MKVIDAEYGCVNALVYDVADVQFEIPSRAEELETIFDAAIDYVEEPVSGCMQSYSLELANGDPAPDYYQVDAETGAIYLENKAYMKIDDDIAVVISSTDGVQPHYPFVQKTTVFKVATACGLDSTTFIAPKQGELYGQSFTGEETVMELSGVFGSTNEMCPIFGHSLESEDFDLLDSGSNGFTVKRKETDPNEVEYTGSRFFMITAIAEGGASFSAEYEMKIVNKPFLSEI